MAQIELLAHRGWWDRPEDRNTPQALNRAFAAGLGVETDVRDCDGEIVVSHDPPRAGKCQTLRSMLDMYAKAGNPGTLALNVKADGLQAPVRSVLQEFRIPRYFVFDMSIPDTLQWLKAEVPVFARQSEFESDVQLYDRAPGVWLDAFQSDWYQADLIATHRAAKKKVAVVSPELHGRPHQNIWNLLSTLPGDGILLCTDLIADARRFFHGQN